MFPFDDVIMHAVFGKGSAPIYHKGICNQHGAWYLDCLQQDIRKRRVDLPGRHLGSHLLKRLTLIPAWISNYVTSEVWGEITDP